MGSQTGKKEILIFGSRACSDWSFLREAALSPDLVIAADGGLSCAREAGFVPDYYIGDGDSGGEAGHTEKEIILPCEKDLTDLQAAYETSRELGADEVIFTACTGGRQDHHLAALQLLETAANQGVHARILDPCNCIEVLLPGHYFVSRDGYRYFSLIPIDRILSGVEISGAKYSLAGRDVRRGDSLTVSNEWVDGPAEISFTGGLCFLIRSRDFEK